MLGSHRFGVIVKYGVRRRNIDGRADTLYWCAALFKIKLDLSLRLYKNIRNMPVMGNLLRPHHFISAITIVKPTNKVSYAKNFQNSAWSDNVIAQCQDWSIFLLFV